jgi:hypothetical protein
MLKELYVSKLKTLLSDPLEVFIWNSKLLLTLNSQITVNLGIILWYHGEIIFEDR